MKTISSSRTAVSLFEIPTEPRTLQLQGVPFRIPWSTPRRLWMLGAGVLASTCLFWSSAGHAVKASRAAAETVGRDCAPSIIAAQHIRTALADLDANLANLLLCQPETKEAKLAMRAADERRKALSESLVTAAQNITFGDEERRPILTIVRSLQVYEASMARARVLQEKGDLAAALGQSRQATELMHSVLIGAADALDRANSTVLRNAYEQQRARAHRAFAALLLCGAILIAALGAAQLFLLRKTQRVLNLGLLGATAAAVFTMGHVAVQTVRSTGTLKAAVEDAFASVHFLWQTRAIAYDANGEESRWLLDPANAAVAERRFLEASGRVAKAPSDPYFRKAADTAAVSTALPGDFSGLLKEELANVTFRGERQAAAEALRRFGAYLATDATIRAEERAGRHAEAVRICLSYEPGGSNRAFDEFDAALGEVLRMNTEAFESSIQQAIGDLSGFGFSIPAAVAVIVAMTAAGLAPRVREYAV